VAGVMSCGIADHPEVQGLIYETIGNASPKGVCGSGLIDCIYEIVKGKIIGADGKFNGNLQDTRLIIQDHIPQEKIQFIGNSSLTGAQKCLLSEAALEKCLNISRSMTNIELSIYQPFMNEYVAVLFLPHTHGKLFPFVNY